jgi:hypothetical protein
METTITIPLGRVTDGTAKYGTLNVDTSRFAQHVHDHVYVYGLRQILNDAIAQKTDDDGRALPDDQLIAKAQKRLDTLYSGELRVRRDAEPTDPVEAEVYRIARTELMAAAKGTDEWKTVPRGTKDRALWVIATRATARDDVVDTWDAAIERYLQNDDRAKRIKREAARRVKEAQAAMTDMADAI